MKCPSCGKTFPDTAKFCPYCGAAVKTGDHDIRAKHGLFYSLGRGYSIVRSKRGCSFLMILFLGGACFFGIFTLVPSWRLQAWLIQLRQTISPVQIRTERRGNDNAEMVFVPAGEFTMGSPETVSLGSYGGLGGTLDEQPQHIVYLDAFWIDKYEVTNAQYKKCMDDGGCQLPHVYEMMKQPELFENLALEYSNYPFSSATWDDANLYCKWAGKHLPTEAEWEKAARGTDERVWPWGNTFDENRLNSRESGRDSLTPVDYFPSGGSPYGAQDMVGNASEWVADWYDQSYYVNSPHSNPKGPSAGKEKVWRGGAWSYYLYDARTASRFHTDPSEPNLGFRCAQ